MPYFTLQIGPGGPVVDAVIAVSAARHSAILAANQTPPLPVPVRALIDTGASCTCVEPSILQQLQLTPTGQGLVYTPTTGATPVACAQYDIGILIPSGGGGAAHFAIPNLMVAAAQPASLQQQGIQALIGRDLLANCVLWYNGGGGFFTLAY